MLKRSLGILLLLPTLAFPAERVYKLVVQSDNVQKSMSRDEVAKLFLKKVTTWPGGQPVIPVDQPRESAVRKAFSRGVLGKDVAAVESYWQQAIFSGRAVPPIERSSDAQVIAFVRDHPNSVGYVSADVDLGASVKELAVE